MSVSEFSLIDSYFKNCGRSAFPVSLGIGDDAAVVDVPAGQQLVMTMDTLIEGVHFPEQTKPEDIAWKALAVNLSDLAAMAATPSWFLLSLSLPHTDPNWLKYFSQSLKQCAELYQIRLIGGDTCQGKLSITIQASGFVDSGRAVGRQGAKPGDKIIVSGQLGNAALGLALIQNKTEWPENMPEKMSAQHQVLCREALNRPKPRLELKQFLQQNATAAIDLSDGLVGDLGHILQQSQVGAKINKHSLPVSDWIRQTDQFHYALSCGDDYELCFTIPASAMAALQSWNKRTNNCPLSCIGEITQQGFTLIDDKVGDEIDLNPIYQNSNDQNLGKLSHTGYQHFV